MLILVCLLINPWANQISEEAKQIETVEVQKELTIEEVLNEVPKKYGVNPEIISKVAFCESSHDPTQINYNDGGPGKHSVGIMQYQKSTFDYWEGKLGEDLNYESTYDQVKLASYMISKNRGHEWTCYRKIYGV